VLVLLRKEKKLKSRGGIGETRPRKGHKRGSTSKQGEYLGDKLGKFER